MIFELKRFDINGDFWEEMGEISIKKAGFIKKIIKVGRLYPNTTSFYKIAWSQTLFTPTFKYFYTDISAISVTFRNSGKEVMV